MCIVYSEGAQYSSSELGPVLKPVGRICRDSSQEQRQKEEHYWRRLFSLSCAFTIPVFLLSMVFPMIPFLRPLLQARIGGLPLGPILKFVLVTPVQTVIGWRFHRGAWIALRNHRWALTGHRWPLAKLEDSIIADILSMRLTPKYSQSAGMCFPIGCMKDRTLLTCINSTRPPTRCSNQARVLCGRPCA